MKNTADKAAAASEACHSPAVSRRAAAVVKAAEE